MSDYTETPSENNSTILHSQLLNPENRTDDEAGRRFARQHANIVKYVPHWDEWLVWDGKRWAIDHSQSIEQLAKNTNDRLWDEITELTSKRDSLSDRQRQDIQRYGTYSASVRGTSNMLTKAASEPDLVVLPDQLDRHPWFLNVENGTIDLRDGILRKHDPNHLITGLAPVSYDVQATCPKWTNFLDEIMAGNNSVISFLRRLVGYWLTGVIREHIVPMFIGDGGNGKGVFLNTIQSLLGPAYAIKAAKDLLMVKKHASHPTELADLFGRRIVIANEIDSGQQFAEALVKDLTGGDKIKARRMKEDFWEFDPTHKVVLAANHKPIVSGTDNGIWRRLTIVPFDVVIPDDQQNHWLGQELQAELPGILNWALFGCAEWQRIGLAEPPEVAIATKDYRDSSDSIGQFIAQECVLNADCHEFGGKLFASYEGWCKEHGHKLQSTRAFGEELTKLGLIVKPHKKGRLRVGIALRVDGDGGFSM